MSPQLTFEWNKIEEVNFNFSKLKILKLKYSNSKNKTFTVAAKLTEKIHFSTFSLHDELKKIRNGNILKKK